MDRSPNLFGLVVPVAVLHVIACDRINVTILGDDDRRTGDITLRLPITAPSVIRPSDPPLLALGSDGRSTPQPGPCLLAQDWTRRRLRRAQSLVAHIPIPCDRRWRRWLDSLTTGSVVTGSLWMHDQDGTWRSLAEVLINEGIATRSLGF